MDKILADGVTLPEAILVVGIAFAIAWVFVTAFRQLG